MIQAVIQALLRWFGEVKRDLPWRRAPEPWRVFVAETMLQQTRIAAVLPRYAAFLARFPDPGAMAAAEEEEVLALWSGLGYYRRARNLHAAARRMVAEHGGRVPDDREALRSLPGVGAYTTGAVLSVAFDRPAPIVDGNVERVLSRLFLVRGNVKRGRAKKRLWELAREAVREGPPADVNQALMELGALVCLPRNPHCEECPLHADCRAREEENVEALPELPPKRRPVEVALAVALVTRGAEALVVRAPEGDFLAGTWTPPFARVPDGAEAGEALARAARRRHGLDLEVGAARGTLRHTITHHRITARCLDARLASDRLPAEARFADRSALAALGLSSLARKALAFGQPGPGSVARAGHDSVE